MKLGADRDNIPDKIILFVDELNKDVYKRQAKYQAATAWREEKTDTRMKPIWAHRNHTRYSDFY